MPSMLAIQLKVFFQNCFKLDCYNSQDQLNHIIRNPKMANTIKIRTFTDLDEVFFKRLISMVKHGINDHKIYHKSNHSSNSAMTQKELLDWMKTDETGCLSTIQEYLQKENLIQIVNQDDPQLEQSFLDTLFDAVWYLSTSTRTGILG